MVKALPCAHCYPSDAETVRGPCRLQTCGEHCPLRRERWDLDVPPPLYWQELQRFTVLAHCYLCMFLIAFYRQALSERVFLATQ